MKKIGATKGGNDEVRERSEGMTEMMLPRPYPKTWFISEMEGKGIKNHKLIHKDFLHAKMTVNLTSKVCKKYLMGHRQGERCLVV